MANWTFSIVDVPIPALDVLQLIDEAGFGSLMTPPGALLNSPTENWFVPIQAVYARPEFLTHANVVVSVWDRAQWERDSAKLELRVHYESGHHAHDAIGMRVTEDRKSELTHCTYDQQRSQTGYEGEHRTERAADDRQVTAFVALVLRLIG